MKSKLFSLNTRDFIRGLIIAILTAVLQLLQIVLLDPALYSFKSVLIRCGWTSVAAIISYLLLNLNTNSKGEILTKDN